MTTLKKHKELPFLNWKNYTIHGMIQLSLSLHTTVHALLSCRLAAVGGFAIPGQSCGALAAPRDELGSTGSPWMGSDCLIPHQGTSGHEAASLGRGKESGKPINWKTLKKKKLNWLHVKDTNVLLHVVMNKNSHHEPLDPAGKDLRMLPTHLIFHSPFLLEEN